MNTIFKVFLFMLVHQCILCQVCNETKSIFREVPETYRFSYIETYEEPCVIFCSVKTRTSVNVTTRLVQRFENVTVNICCDGYVENNNHEKNGLYCEPVCNPPCQNGYCRRPNQCACEAGYALHPLDSHVCKPLCLEGCDIPECISTENPQCFPSNSSEPTTNRKSPVCREPCINSNCVGPEICQCFPGYHQTSAFNCEPTSYFATESCKHGTLVDPYTCLCDQGWLWKCGSCQPICEQCDHGTCVVPGKCVCDYGYVMERGKCEPQCSNGCANGRCVSPELCSCNPGWYKTDEGECKAHCDMNCKYGDCIVPNICECHIGYQLYINKEISKCVPNRKDCEGSSSDPNACKCEAPYEVRYFSDNGDDCNCKENCNSYSSKCIKATCLFMNVAFDMNPPDFNNGYDRGEKTAVIKETPDMEDYEISTLPTDNENKHTENNNDILTPTESNYYYDSDEEESDDQTSDVKVALYNNSDEITKLSSIGKNENTEKMYATNITTEPNYDHSEETDKIADLKVSYKTKEVKVPILSTIDRNNNTLKINTTTEIAPELKSHEESKESPDLKETPGIKDNESSTHPNIEITEITEVINMVETALNSKNATIKREEVILSIYWILAAGIIGILFVVLILACVVRKCFKKHSLNISGKSYEISAL